MSKELFIATYNGNQYEFELLQKKFELFVDLKNPQRISLKVKIISKEREVNFYDEDEGIQSIMDDVGIFIESIQLPICDIKQRNFRTLENIIINFEQDLSLNEHPLLDKYSDSAGLITTSMIHPSGDPIIALSMSFQHVHGGIFLVYLQGKTDDLDSISTFEVSCYMDMQVCFFNGNDVNELVIPPKNNRIQK